MYAVSFDLDTSCLGDNYHVASSANAYGDIRKFLESRGFTWTQGSVYFGDSSINAVSCVVLMLPRVHKEDPKSQRINGSDIMARNSEQS